MTGASSPIVVAFDGSADSRVGAAWAATEASSSGARVELVGVFDWTSEAAGIFGPFVADTYRDDALARLESELRIEADHLRAAYPSVTISVSVRTGSPAAILIDTSATAAMLVLGARGVSRVAELLVGSVSHAVAAAAVCPVIVVNDRPAGGFAVGPVIVGIDGSPSSLSALVFAAAFAKRHGLRVDAIRACSSDWVASAILRDGNDVDPQVAALEYGILHDDIAKTGVADDVVVTTTVVYKHPVRALLDASTGASLVVVGTRGHGSVRSRVVGSVSESLIRASHCPVSVVSSEHDWDNSTAAASSLAGITT